MQPLEKFMSRLLPSLPGCPTPLAHQSIVDAAIEFCDETGAIQYSPDPQKVSKGQYEYDVDLPADTELSRLMTIHLDGRPLLVTATSPQAAAPGTPTSAHVNMDGGITLHPHPHPEYSATLTMHVATRPTRDAKSLDDQLHSRWAEALTAGAFFRLCTMPGQAFTDAMYASLSQAKFNLHLNRGRIESRRNNAAVDMRVRNRPFA